VGHNQQFLSIMTRIPVSDPTQADYYRWQFSLCWRSVVAGTLAAIGIQILLTILGLGAGLATFSPLTDEKPLEHFDVGNHGMYSTIHVGP